ncbi:FkbM family methyltransferase [Caballeronia glebae]|uniref:FkbM family methyltransferase n=1 Tax=Caballeronia glebae TaxID=1777143 RepID=UPI0038BBB775
MRTDMMSAICDLEQTAYRSNTYTNRMLRYGLSKLVKNVILPFRDPLVKRTVRSTDMMLSLSHMLPKYALVHPYYDSLLPSLVKYLIAKGDIVFVDIGANIGDTAKLVHAAGGDKVSFICIEADETYFPVLQMNLRNVNASCHLVLAGAETTLLSTSAQRNSFGTTSYEIGQGNKTQVMATDDIIDGRRVDIVKIDTDGFELEVLKGMTRTLSEQNAALFIEFSPWHLKTYGKARVEDIVALLREAEYRHVIVYDHVGMPLTLTDIEQLSYMANYCAMQKGFYFDLLCHKQKPFLESFYQADLPRFETRSWD